MSSDAGRRHDDVHDDDEAHLTEWTPDIRIMITGFDQVFLAESQRAADRAAEGVTRSDAPAIAGATAAAVLLAAAACEARLSEYVTHHASEIGDSDVEALRGEPDALEQWRRLLRNRAPAFRYGDRREYLALGCLFRLRNLVAHRNARHLPLGEWPTELADCVRQRAIPVTQSAEIDWTSGAYDQRVARWAYQTAADWLTIVSGLGIA